ncbi:Putative J-type chaperone [Penicillium brasilianum]|uniref:Putative J-type chaperone n=1 Tax=Penicillium brasilianum TaxID=104259 RepID=A0A0F7TNY4_PENBI|nr:Putative J-type chaperone [Penicillium brasilianum]
MALRGPNFVRNLCRSAKSRTVATSSRQGLISPSQRDECTLYHSRTQSRRNQTLGSTRSIYTPSSVTIRRAASTAASPQTPTESSEPSVTGAPDITNHYTIFPKTLPAGPPPASPFEISIGDLRREFLQLQGTVHPDKYPSGPAKQHAEALSARINEAYRTLSDPLQRAQYLLRELHGIDVTAEDASTKHALDAATLMEVMEVQETIEEVGASPEAEAEIDALKDENQMRIAGCVDALAKAFDRGDIEGARAECVKLRFWYSVGEGLREWEPGSTEIRLVHGS